MKTISLGFSTCPNDTFIFYALIEKKVNLRELCFQEILADVEKLNKMAFEKMLDVTKLSYQAFGLLLDDYILLRSGGALGRGCGPILVSASPVGTNDLIDKKIAIPGRHTTAAMLLKLYNNDYKNLVEMSFEKIMTAVKTGAVDAGLIIHEGRFTYEKEGLFKLVDLGDWWEETTGFPIPLGGIVARRDLGEETLAVVESGIRRSVEYAMLHPEEPMAYIKEYAQELSENVIREHVALYVNSFSLDIGEEGINAIKYLLKTGYEKGIFKNYRDDFVLEPR